MEVFLWLGGKECGPFSLEQVYDMDKIGSLAGDTQAWTAGQPDWLPLKKFLSDHPLWPPPKTPPPASDGWKTHFSYHLVE